MKLSVTIILKPRFLKLSTLINFYLKHSLPPCDACFAYRSSACFWKPWLISSSFTKMTCRIGFLFSWHSCWRKWEQICWGLCRQKFRKLWMSPGKVLKWATLCRFLQDDGKAHGGCFRNPVAPCILRPQILRNTSINENKTMSQYLKHNVSSV